MYRDRLVETHTSSSAEKQLQTVMIAYHDFQHRSASSSLNDNKLQLAEWQSQRLKRTHEDFYCSSEYNTGLEFLMSQLYAAEDFSARDRDLERIFPKVIKWLPESVIETAASLVELNLLTHTLDETLCDALFNQLKVQTIDADSYAAAYRLCDNYEERCRQIVLVQQAGERLDRYARSTMINWSLKASRSPAKKAGLSALHEFLENGFSAFHTMKDIDHLMTTVVQREQRVLDNIFESKSDPFDLNEDP